MSSEESESELTTSHYPAPTLYASDQWIAMGTGCYYKGEWNHRTMCGNGVYVMPDGNYYIVHKHISIMSFIVYNIRVNI